jgi:hypothetical protein
MKMTMPMLLSRVDALSTGIREPLTGCYLINGVWAVI